MRKWDIHDIVHMTLILAACLLWVVILYVLGRIDA